MPFLFLFMFMVVLSEPLRIGTCEPRPQPLLTAAGVSTVCFDVLKISLNFINRLSPSNLLGLIE